MSDDEQEVYVAPRWKRWKGRLVALLLIVAGGLHAFKPLWLTLDWPSIVLILGGVLLLFLPVDDIGTMIQSLEIGNTKILFRDIRKLDQSVERAEAQAETAVLSTQKKNANQSVQSKAIVESWAGESALWNDLLSGDKELALIKIGIEIERSLSELESLHGLKVSPNAVWSRNLRALEDDGIITGEVSLALSEFRKVRNRLVHPSDMRVPESLIASAIDSGVKLIRLIRNLSAIADLGE